MRLDSQRPHIFFCLVILLTACHANKPALELAPNNLKQAARVVEHMLEPRQLSRSAFSVVFAEGTPSQFVSFMFSDIGTAEWPDSEAMAEQNPMLREQAQAIGAPLIPKGVAIIARAPSPKSGKQIVVKADDGRGVVIVEGYTDPTLGPVLVREYRVPKVKAAPGVKEIYEAKRDIYEANRELEMPHRKD
jgi:hypothetical protein